MMYGWGDGGWGVLWMVVTMLVFWGGLAALVILLSRSWNDDRRRGDGERRQDRSAIDLLQERFARGEIDDEEYRARVKVLQGSPP